MEEEKKPEAPGESSVVKAKKHVKRNKRKYAAGSTVALVIALLEVYTQYCSKLPGVLRCEETHEKAKP